MNALKQECVICDLDLLLVPLHDWRLALSSSLIDREYSAVPVVAFCT